MMRPATAACLTARAARRRFLVLTALRWLPVGLVIPVMVLMPLDRGLSLSQIGLAVSVQGFVVLALELPTGGMADTIGRRAVLLAAGVVGIASLSVMLLSSTAAGFAVAYLLQGIYRALDSGPLEAWYVDASLAADPGSRVDEGLSAAGVVLGLAVGTGALGSGGLIALGDRGPVDALAVPFVAALLVQVVGLVAVALLIVEERPSVPPRRALRAVGETRTVIVDGVRLLRSSRVLRWVVLVELTWGFGSATYEALFPVRLTELLADPEAAAVVTGPAGAAAWLASAAGAAATPFLIRGLGAARTAGLLRLLQGATVLAMGLLGGVVGVVSAYLACYAVHGSSNPAHMTLLHRQVEGPHRATVISINSMMAQPAGAVGVIVLTAVADGTSTTPAMVIGGLVLALAAPFYLPALGQERRKDQDAPAPAAESSSPTT